MDKFLECLVEAPLAELSTSVIKELIPHLDDSLTPPVSFSIVTKYYQADCLIHSIVISNNTDISELPSYSNEVDALIWVYDALDPSQSLLASESWIKRFTDEFQPNVCVCLGSTVGAGFDTADNREWVVEFCLDRGFEWIPPTTLDHSDEPAGVERLRECLECNLWDGLVRIGGEGNPSFESSISLNEPDSGSVDDVVVAKEDLELEKVCGMMKRFTASILAEEEKPASSIETEEDFGLILTEFKRFRERNIELGDEERRRRAEQFALKFLDCFEE